MLISFLVFIFTLLILVTIHEWGHFAMAQCMGVKVLRFSVGFGKPLIIWRGKSGIEYTLNWMPLGGYVRLLDEREGKVEADEKPFAFNRQPLWRRILIVMAGPAINLLFACMAFWLVFVLGIESVKPVIKAVVPHSIAARAGVQSHQIIQSVNSHKTQNWQDVAFALVGQLGEKRKLTLRVRDFPHGALQTFKLTLENWKVNDLEPDLIKSLGIIPYHPPLLAIIGELEKKSAAYQAGLRVGDRVVAVDGEKVEDWESFVKKILVKPNKKITLTLFRGTKQKTFSFKTSRRFVWQAWKTVGFIGVKPEKPNWPTSMKVEEKYTWIGAIGPAIKETGAFLKLNAIIVAKMIKGKVSLRALGGPITIYQVAGQAFKQGAVVYVSFLGLMSVMLAFVNILPIPGLDGGHLIYFIIEAIRKKPLSAQAQLLMLRLGMIVLIVLVVQVMINDLMRLF